MFHYTPLDSNDSSFKEAQTPANIIHIVDWTTEQLFKDTGWSFTYLTNIDWDVMRSTKRKTFKMLTGCCLEKASQESKLMSSICLAFGFVSPGIPFFSVSISNLIPEDRCMKHIIIKIKERILKVAKEKWLITCKGAPIRYSEHFSAETFQARREWDDIFKVLNEQQQQQKKNLATKNTLLGKTVLPKMKKK